MRKLSPKILCHKLLQLWLKPGNTGFTVFFTISMEYWLTGISIYLGIEVSELWCTVAWNYDSYSIYKLVQVILVTGIQNFDY